MAKTGVPITALILSKPGINRRIFLCFQKKNSDKIFWFFTMQNLLKPQNDLLNMPENRIDYRLDLKGYQAKNRRLSEKKLQRDEITYKEWEFNGPENEKALFPDGITLEEGIYELIAKNLANDSMVNK